MILNKKITLYVIYVFIYALIFFVKKINIELYPTLYNFYIKYYFMQRLRKLSRYMIILIIL